MANENEAVTSVEISFDLSRGIGLRMVYRNEKRSF